MSSIPQISADDAFRRRRRAALARHPAQMGLDYASVADPSVSTERQIVLYFVPAAPGLEDKYDVLDDIVTEQLIVRETEEGSELKVLAVTHPAHSPRLELRVGAGSANPAILQCQSCTVSLTGLATLDPFFASVRLSLRLDDPLPLDCDPDEPAAAAAIARPPPAIDYLARDFWSFRGLILERLSVLLPQWQERNPADGLIAISEAMADTADRISYFQDAVATEAYLGTARLRTSVRRHARLLAYPMHEGNNARAWVQIEVAGPDAVELPADSRLMTRVPGLPPRLEPDSIDLERALSRGALTFQTLHAAVLHAQHNAIDFYTWGATEATLERGAMRATLAGDLPHLAAGDVLIFAEVLGPTSGRAADADPEKRHAVRLTRVASGRQDPLGGSLLDPPTDEPLPITEIEWHAADALPFAMPVVTCTETGAISGISVARGNIVLADHGLSVAAEDLEVSSRRRFRPRLERRGLTHRVADEATSAAARPASQALTQDPRQALPALHLTEVDSTDADSTDAWHLRRDLLTSDRFARDFVVEMEGDSSARLRFGDGNAGRRPATASILRATYRVGNGSAGNMGRDSLTHVVSSDHRLIAISNPLPARGGNDPESIEQVRLSAPLAFCADQPCLTTEEFTERVASRPEVKLAATSLRWTGSWYTLVVGVQLQGDRALDDELRGELTPLLEDVRQAGYELEVVALEFVGLDIALSVSVAADAVAAAVEQRLLDTFSNRDLADGRRGFFHPARLSLGQPVYLSEVVTTALAVAGVTAVDFDETPPKPNRFRRFGQPSQGELAAGRIRLRRLEIPRVDNDPDAPQHGRIRFFLEGGR